MAVLDVPKYGYCVCNMVMPGMQVQSTENEKTGLLLFHAENIDGVIELDNGKALHPS